MLQALAKKFRKVNFLVLISLAVVLYVMFFYSYNRFKNREQVYVVAVMGGGGNIEVAVPYWVADAINVGDKDLGVFGQINAEVIDKESYEGGGQGKHVVLIMKVNTTKDRSGQYLFKNKPLALNWWLETRLGSTSYGVTVIYLDKNPPHFEKKLLRVVVRRKNDEIFYADNIKVGNEMKNNKGEIMAKLIDKKVTPAEVRSETAGGQAVVSYDQSRRDMELTVDLLAKKINETFYFAEIKKIKLGETINLHFKETSLWDSQIIKVSEIEQPSKTSSGFIINTLMRYLI